jgi:hypothetical protein
MALYEKGPVRIHYQETGSPVPVLVMPNDTASHPYQPAIESAMLAPRSEPTFFPWKDTKEKIILGVRHVRTFLEANRPA